MKKTVITLHTEDVPDYMYVGDEWKDYTCENFDEVCILKGNRDYKSIENASWWKAAKEVLDDLECLNKEDFIEEYKTGEYELKVPDILEKYNAWNGRYEDDILIQLSELLFNIELEAKTIRGYCQSEWEEAIYIKGKLDPDILEAYFFGLLFEVHIEPSNDFDFWDHMLNTDFWELERTGNLKQELRIRYEVPDDEELIIRKHAGYTRVETFEEI